MPVWHASVSIREPVTHRYINSPGRIERIAIAELEGVGNDREWWIYGAVDPQDRHTKVGHLRIGVTLEEFAALPDFPALADAGPSGPERSRSYPRRKVRK